MNKLKDDRLSNVYWIERNKDILFVNSEKGNWAIVNLDNKMSEYMREDLLSSRISNATYNKLTEEI